MTPIAASPALRMRASHMYFSLALAARSTSEWWFFTQGLEGSCRGTSAHQHPFLYTSDRTHASLISCAICRGPFGMPLQTEFSRRQATTVA